jgi:hypothetical protein
MSDDEAYMALLLTNTQSELTPLEEGLHALHSGLSQRAYAKQAGKASGTVQKQMEAARVAAHCIDIDAAALQPYWLALHAIHAAPQWLWLALAQHLLWETWTVEETRRQVKRVQQLAEPPAWTDKSLGRSVAPSR